MKLNTLPLTLSIILISFTACENATINSKNIAKANSENTANHSKRIFEENSFSITPLEFASSEAINILEHSGIRHPLRFQLDYHSKKKVFNLWAEVWRGEQMSIKRILYMGRYEEDSSEKESKELGTGAFQVEISENHQMLKDFDRVTINTFIKRGSKLNQYSSFDIDSFPKGGVHHLLQNVYTESQNFYFTYACYGGGACSSLDHEFPNEVKSPSRTGEECTVIFRGLFADSYKEFMNFFQDKYGKYRPFESDYNLEWEDDVDNTN